MPTTRPAPHSLAIHSPGTVSVTVEPARPRHPRPALAGLVAPFLAAALLALLAIGAQPAAVQAQSPFSAVAYVNDAAITRYEVGQRARFLEFIGAGQGDLREEALERLIEDELHRQEARRLGLRVGNDDITAGMTEFASRGELTLEEMNDRLREAGIDIDTFRNFIHAGVLWRELVNGIYGPEIRITDADIDRALSLAAVMPVTEYQISELFLPDQPEFAEDIARVTPQILAITSVEVFADAARQISASPSGEEGGRIDRWIPEGELSPEVNAAFSRARVGQVVGPIEFPGAIAFFQLRAQRNTRDVAAGQVEYEFRRVGLPGGQSDTNRARFAEISARVDGCADLGALVGQVAPELPAGAVSTITRARRDLDAATAAELGRLNPGGLSANLTQSGEMVVLMLCNRRVIADPSPSRAQVRERLFNQALERQAEVYISQLRAEAEIRRP